MLKSYPGSYAIMAIIAIVLAGAIASTALLTAPTQQRIAVTVTNQSINTGSQIIDTGDPWMDNPLYCEKDADCLLQSAGCSQCHCGKPVNFKNHVEVACTGVVEDCETTCTPVSLHCIENQCVVKKTNNWQVVKNIDIVNQQFTFDGCGRVTEYQKYNWFQDFEWQLAEAEVNLSEIRELCYSENGQMVVFIVPQGYCKSGNIYRFDIGSSNMLKADVIGHDRGCLAGFDGFGKRIGNFIKVTGTDGDAGCSSEMHYDYNFLSNYVELISEFNYCQQDRDNGTWSYHAGSLCDDEPKTSAIGRELYPTDPKYGELDFLGELFTAAECGSERLNQLYGVQDNQYYLGSNLTTVDNPSKELVETLQSIGYYCTIKTNPYACNAWELPKVIPLHDMLKLKPYHKEIEYNDCLNCG